MEDLGEHSRNGYITIIITVSAIIGIDSGKTPSPSSVCLLFTPYLVPRFPDFSTEVVPRRGWWRGPGWS